MNTADLRELIRRLDDASERVVLIACYGLDESDSDADDTEGETAKGRLLRAAVDVRDVADALWRIKLDADSVVGERA